MCALCMQIVSGNKAKIRLIDCDAKLRDANKKLKRIKPRAANNKLKRVKSEKFAKADTIFEDQPQYIEVRIKIISILLVIYLF